ncbi:GNAT family N-acetyltransferase [Aquipuribacter nitratireducens]|uniref:GNAT family N-acetyltransferase n=1 Tax=Aquipuribacter nitratireducens TaxID=650104 RepID=A0ABW0GJV2_9MICO
MGTVPTIDTIRRLEAVQVAVVRTLVDGLVATGCTEPVPTAVPLGSGCLVVTGPRRYVNRAVGVTLEELGPVDVEAIVRHYADAGLTPAVEVSSWAPATTVAALGAAGFVPAWCRSVLAVDVRDVVADPPSPGPGGRSVEVVAVGDDTALAACAADVMVDETLRAGGDRTTSDEFMAADFSSPGATQLLATLDGEPVGCGSLWVVEDAGTRTGWLGAAATVPSARGRGVQTALVRHRLRLAAAAGCDLAAATASVGSTSSRVLSRCGFGLVQDQWVVQRA